ncbi:hypothetical protein BGZ98_007105 [Dissophora globulifera]|nr:hypothetical protein BGZ98_007105 [Dissophora globulifera]
MGTHRPQATAPGRYAPAPCPTAAQANATVNSSTLVTAVGTERQQQALIHQQESVGADEQEETLSTVRMEINSFSFLVGCVTLVGSGDGSVGKMHSKMYSLRGQRAYQRSMRAYQQVMALRQKNAKFAWYQPFVKDHRKILEDLQQQIDKGDTQEALRLAKILMRAKQRGARLPDGIQLLKLVRMDREHYERRMMLSATQSARLNSATLQDSSSQMDQLPYLVRFSTKDYNTILERCIDLKDWGNGIKIARVLQKRYSAETFDFYASKTNKDAPNTRTIHLLLAMFVRCQSPVNASKVLKLMHNRYPHPIPVDVYTAFVSELSTVPGQISTIESVIEYMREHGPAPTTTVYNPLLRAKAIQEGIESAETVVKKMMRLGYSADQQSFRILIDGSLKALDMGRAHHWLAEYRRQGFEVRPDTLESFMQTCIQQVLRRCTNTARHFRHSIRNHSNDLKSLEPASGTLDTADDGDAHPQEWMYKALQVIQYMSSQRIPPTAKTFELLIEGFLCQQNIYEAKRVLKTMRVSPNLYTPAPRTWSLFFEHYLATDDHEAAIRVLSEMRRVMSTQPLAGAISVPPTKHYHQLFRHLIQRNKVSLAERSLYEMMLHQNRAHPSEKEVVDLIWKLDRYPEAAERVYELLYSQITPPTSALTLATLTMTMAANEEKEEQRGPIQMANVGVMRAKANAKNPLLQGEVWKSWNSMTQRFMDQYSSQALSDDERQRQRLALRKENDLSVMALAFEQVVKAMTKVSSSSSIPTVDQQQQQQQQRLRGRSSHEDRQVLSSVNGGGLDGVDKDRMADGWDFNQIRQSLGGGGASFGSGLGLSNAGAGIVPFSFAGISGGSSSSSSAAAVVATAASSIKSKNRMLIQQLLRRRQFLQPLLERGDVVNESATSDIGGHEDIRLEHLKCCFAWVEEHKIPIRIEGLNGYLASLISHGDFSAACESVERVLLSSSSSPSSSSSSSDTSRSRLLPDVNTVQILHEYRMSGSTSGAETQGAYLVERVLRAGGPDLKKEWTTYLRNPERRRRGTITTTSMAGNGMSDGSRSSAAFV